MKVVVKALAAVLREGPAGPEVLAFRHPTAGLQLPKGTVEPGETIAAGARRELREESGLVLDGPLEHLGVWERVVRGGPNEDGPWEVNRWWVTVIRADRPLPDRWEHRAEGSPAEEGLVFRFAWLPLDARLPGALDPLFETIAAMLLHHAEVSSRQGPDHPGGIGTT